MALEVYTPMSSVYSLCMWLKCITMAKAKFPGKPSKTSQIARLRVSSRSVDSMASDTARIAAKQTASGLLLFNQTFLDEVSSRHSSTRLIQLPLDQWPCNHFLFVASHVYVFFKENCSQNSSVNFPNVSISRMKGICMDLRRILLVLRLTTVLN